MKQKSGVIFLIFERRIIGGGGARSIVLGLILHDESTRKDCIKKKTSEAHREFLGKGKESETTTERERKCQSNCELQRRFSFFE